MKIKKKLLFLIETYPSGGSDKVVRILSDYYSKKFEINILVNKSNDLKFFQNLKKNIILIKYKLPNLGFILSLNKNYVIKQIISLIYLVKYVH